MILSDEAKVAFWQELRTYEEERQMPYITSVEQIGYDRGIEEKAIAIALNMLRKNLDVETIAEVTGLSIAQIQSLQGQLN
jgi:predicted transposase/invertase (TIGR01784 family)